MSDYARDSPLVQNQYKDIYTQLHPILAPGYTQIWQALPLYTITGTRFYPYARYMPVMPYIKRGRLAVMYARNQT